VWLFDEQLTLVRVAGAIAIIAGIVCLGFAENSEHAAAPAPAAADS
jgi:drug/metabolite transporter (DMT)-like permease